jgi:hypothetical protein
MDTARCMQCGMPGVDHVPLRYPFRAAWRHALLRTFGRWLNKIDDTNYYL